MGDEWHEEWDKQTWRVIGVVVCMGFHAHERNNKNERRVGLMGGESAWHRRIWA